MRLIGAIFFFPILALAQGELYISTSLKDQKISFYLTAYSTAESNEAVSLAKVQNLLNKLEAKRNSFKSEKCFLNFVFYKTHQALLKHYGEYATFNNTLKKGTYNCLTGTAIYALILERFNLPYKIIETNYHIFLLAETAEGKILFEATDPLKGFISNELEIEKRIDQYKNNIVAEANSNKTYYRYSMKLFNSVSLDEMLGLLHYNLAVGFYNKHDLESSIVHLEKAIRLYQSPRIDEFSKIVQLTVLESKLEMSVKENLLRQMQFMRSYRMPAVASASR